MTSNVIFLEVHFNGHFLPNILCKLYSSGAVVTLCVVHKWKNSEKATLCGIDNPTLVFFRMMLQHSGPSLADISCSAMVPCLSPPGTLTLDDFTNFTPIVKEELRLAIQNKRLSNGLSPDMSSDGASSSSDRAYEHPAGGSGGRREVRRRGNYGV